jgi:WD40 repeat protein
LTKWTRRNPRTTALLLLCGLAILAFLVGQTVMSIRLSRANTRVEAANVDLTRSLYEAQWRQADEAERADERGEAIARFSHFLGENPSDADAAARLLSLLSSCNFPVLLVPPLVHETPVVALDFSRAGDRLATASSGGMARLWNVESGKLEVELAHPAPLNKCLLCGENDDHLLTVSSEPKARLWDLGSRRRLSELELGPLNNARTPRVVEMTRDRRRVAVNVRSNVLEVLDNDSGVWLQPGLVFPTEISRLAMSANGRLLAASSTSELRLYKFGSEQPLFPPVDLASPPDDIRFSDDGRWLACSCQNKVWLMDTSTGLREPEFAAEAFYISFLGRTDRLITSSSDASGPMSLVDPHTGKNCGSPFGQLDFDARWHGALLFSDRDIFPSYLHSCVRLLDPATGHPQTEPFIHDGPITAVRLRADGRVVATASQDRTVRLWSAEMRPAEPLTLAFGGPVWEAQWSPSGDRIMYAYVAGNRMEMRVSDSRTGAADAPPAELDGSARWFAQWSLDGTRVAASGEFSAVIWNAQDNRPLSPLLRHNGKNLAYCAFSPDGEVLATSGDDQAVRLWDGHTGRAINSPLIHSDNPLKISFTSDSSRLATACVDGTIRVWSVPEGKLVLGPLHHSGICWVAAFSPDNRWLVSASSDSTAQLWDARTGQQVLPPFRHEGPVLWASFSPDGHAIATSTEFGTARVWDTASGQLLTGPMKHPGKVWYVKWSPDGRFLATTCTDGAARVWDALTGHLVAQPFRHDAEVRRAEFSPDGQRLLSAGYDGAVKVWDLSFLRPPLPIPDWLPALVESLGGKRIGPKDSMESVPGDRFQIAKARVERWGKKDYYGRWAQWLLQERFERPVKPFQP